MLLALDTATATASLAVYDDEHDRVLAEATWLARRRQTQDLLVTARELLVRLDLCPDELTALAVTTGPGSFTGVRIAISTVKGIGLGLASAPRVVGIPTLAVTAAPWLALATSLQSAVAVCACLQAGRGRYNWCCFGAEDRLWRPAAADHGAGSAQDLADFLNDSNPTPIWLVGEIAPDLVEATAGCSHVHVVDNISGWRRAGHLAHLAVQHLTQGAGDQLASLQPLYLRAP